MPDDKVCCPVPEKMKTLSYNDAVRWLHWGYCTQDEFDAYHCAWHRMAPRFAHSAGACETCGAPATH